MRLKPGETGYLYPTVPTAPGVTYSTPAVTVISEEWPRLTVELDGGRRIEIDEQCVIRTLPDSHAPRRRGTAEKVRWFVPEGYEELKLW